MFEKLKEQINKILTEYNSSVMDIKKLEVTEFARLEVREKTISRSFNATLIISVKNGRDEITSCWEFTI